MPWSRSWRAAPSSAPTTADGTGAWSFTPAGLIDGAHTLTATQTDLAGNTGTATLSFMLDTSLAGTALYGTAGNDVLTGTIIGHNVIYGLGGNDTISVSYSSATTELYGGDGDDIITGQSVGRRLYRWRPRKRHSLRKLGQRHNPGRRRQ